MLDKVASETTYEKMGEGEENVRGGKELREIEREGERERESSFLFMHCPLLMV